MGLNKKLEHYNERISIKMQKSSIFWAFWAEKANFGQFLVKMGEMSCFQKSAWTIFSTFTAKIQKKINKYKRMNELTDERTRAKFKVLTNLHSTNQLK